MVFLNIKSLIFVMAFSVQFFTIGINGAETNDVTDGVEPWAALYTFEQSAKSTVSARSGTLEILQNYTTTAFSYEFAEDDQGEGPAVVVALGAINGELMTVVVHTMAKAVEVKRGHKAARPSVMATINYPVAHEHIKQTSDQPTNQNLTSLTLPDGYAYSLEVSVDGSRYDELYSTPQMQRQVVAGDYEEVSPSQSIPQHVEVEINTVDGKVQSESFFLIEAIPFTKRDSLAGTGLSIHISPFLLNDNLVHAVEAFLSRGYSLQTDPEIVNFLSLEPTLVPSQ